MDDTQTSASMETRRRLAVQKVQDGWSQADVADFLGVHPVTVNKWVRAHRANPEAGLSRKPHPGRKPFLTAEQERQVLGWLTEKPTAHGFPTDLWTARRVADLIRRKFQVAFNPGYLREWLSKRGLSPQKPAKRSRERNPAAVATWLADVWPALQKKRRLSRPTSC